MPDVVPNQGIANILSAALRSADPVKVRLAKNTPSLSPATVLGDFTEADFSGYSPQDANPLAPPVVSDLGRVQTQGLPVSFAHSGGPTSNTISVYYVTLETGAGSKLLWAGTVEDAPKTMAGVTDILDITIMVQGRQET